MKILIAVPCMELPGGVGNYYRTLRPHLDADKVYFEIGTRSGEEAPLARMIRLFADFWQFHRKLSKESWDLVHINPSMAIRAIIRDGVLLLIARAHGRPVLVFFHGWLPACVATIRRRCLGIFRSVYGRAAAFIVLAAEFESTLAEMGLKVPTFIDTTLVDDDLLAAGPTPERPPAVEAGACEILYLGRLDRGKGLPEAIEAFARLREQKPRVRLVIAGDGPERRLAEEMIRSRAISGVRFLGHVDGAEKLAAFRSADIYLFTSLAEGMPISVLEAMALGLPVVTGAVGGLRDFFESERMGYLVTSGDPDDYARLLGKLAENPGLRRSMGDYNRAFARQRFAASVVAARLREIYEQVGRLAAGH